MEKDSNLARTAQTGSKIFVADAGESVELPCQAFPSLETPSSDLEQTNYVSANANAGARRAARSNRRQQRRRQTREATSVGGHLASRFERRADLPLFASADLHSGDEEEGSESRRKSDDNLGDHLISLVFWYKDDNPAPIYTLDARQALVLSPDFGLAQQKYGGGESFHTSPPANRSLASQIATLNRRLIAEARHYYGSPQMSAGKRMSVHLESGGGPSEGPLVIRLRLSDLEASQSGDYKCRVDFRRARTIRQTVRLFVQGECGTIRVPFVH